jgi:hypothetical protein
MDMKARIPDGNDDNSFLVMPCGAIYSGACVAAMERGIARRQAVFANNRAPLAANASQSSSPLIPRRASTFDQAQGFQPQVLDPAALDQHVGQQIQDQLEYLKVSFIELSADIKFLTAELHNPKFLFQDEAQFNQKCIEREQRYHHLRVRYYHSIIDTTHGDLVQEETLTTLHYDINGYIFSVMGQLRGLWDLLLSHFQPLSQEVGLLADAIQRTTQEFGQKSSDIDQMLSDNDEVKDDQIFSFNQFLNESYNRFDSPLRQLTDQVSLFFHQASCIFESIRSDEEREFYLEKIRLNPLNELQSRREDFEQQARMLVRKINFLGEKKQRQQASATLGDAANVDVQERTNALVSALIREKEAFVREDANITQSLVSLQTLLPSNSNPWQQPDDIQRASQLLFKLEEARSARDMSVQGHQQLLDDNDAAETDGLKIDLSSVDAAAPLRMADDLANRLGDFKHLMKARNFATLQQATEVVQGYVDKAAREKTEQRQISIVTNERKQVAHFERLVDAIEGTRGGQDDDLRNQIEFFKGQVLAFRANRAMIIQQAFREHQRSKALKANANQSVVDPNPQQQQSIASAASLPTSRRASAAGSPIFPRPSAASSPTSPRAEEGRFEQLMFVQKPESTTNMPPPPPPLPGLLGAQTTVVAPKTVLPLVGVTEDQTLVDSDASVRLLDAALLSQEVRSPSTSRGVVPTMPQEVTLYPLNILQAESTTDDDASLSVELKTILVRIQEMRNSGVNRQKIDTTKVLDELFTLESSVDTKTKSTELRKGITEQDDIAFLYYINLGKNNGTNEYRFYHQLLSLAELVKTNSGQQQQNGSYGLVRNIEAQARVLIRSIRQQNLSLVPTDDQIENQNRGRAQGIFSKLQDYINAQYPAQPRPPRDQGASSSSQTRQTSSSTTAASLHHQTGFLAQTIASLRVVGSTALPTQVNASGPSNTKRFMREPINREEKSSLKNIRAALKTTPKTRDSMRSDVPANSAGGQSDD